MTNETNEKDIFQCKMYITDLETGQDSKEIDVEDLVFKDWIEFEFGNYGDENYGALPYKDFKFFINDYAVTFYSPLVKKLNDRINKANELIKQYDNTFIERSLAIKLREILKGED